MPLTAAAPLRTALAAVAILANAPTSAQEPRGLHESLERLARSHEFSGAVVVTADGTRFARGYGLADPFTGRRFTPDTPVDSASLAKPVTAAAVIMLARDGTIDLDAPVRRYLPEYAYASTTVRHLLAHSAGLPEDGSEKAVTGKTNYALLAELRDQRRPLLFETGIHFNYCNLCTITLAVLVERVSGLHYLDFARRQLMLPRGVTLRPARLADWASRAIGYRRTADGKIERADSYDDERFYGPGNLSISASQLALWGTYWWRPPLSSIRAVATTPAVIAGRPSGLTWGNWYCARNGRRCHYLGHHEGFHHMLYWNADRRVSVALVSNNSLAPSLHQRLQRAVVDYAEGRPRSGRRELASRLPDRPVIGGRYQFPTGEIVAVSGNRGTQVTVERHGVEYPAYLIGIGVRYVPGLDVYIAGGPDNRLHWLSLYEDFQGVRASPAQVTGTRPI